MSNPTFFKILTLSALLLGAIAFGQERKGKGIGRVVTVSGSAQVLGRQLKVGDSVYVADTILTGPESTVKLLLADRSVIDISPSTSFQLSRFKLNKMSDREVEGKVDFGQVRSLVSKKLNEKGRYNFRTKSSVLAVRGTEFFLRAGDEKLPDLATVGDGTVWASSTAGKASKEAVLKPGKQWTNRAAFNGGRDTASTGGLAGTTEVKTLSRGDFSRFVAANRVRDNTLNTALVIGGSESGDRAPAAEAGDKPETKGKKNEKKDSGNTTLDTIQETVNKTIVADNKQAPVIDDKNISVPGMNRNPVEVVKPISTNEPQNQIVNVRVKIN